jgi:putative endonuclease
MKRYFVYILLCADKSYYTGVTNNLEARVVQHNAGIETNSYVYSRRPVRLLWHADFTSIDKAIDLEKQIKGWSRAKKEALIRGEFELLPLLGKKNF